VAHEIGHVLGLDHTDDGLMRPTHRRYDALGKEPDFTDSEIDKIRSSKWLTRVKPPTSEE
jgi:predicted Zn-dependent protease